MTRVFALSRYLVLFAVIGLLLAAVAVFLYGGIATINTIIKAFAGGQFDAKGARMVGVEFIKMIDLFLLGTVLLITSIGLYQLFIDPKNDLPKGLRVPDFEQLKFIHDQLGPDRTLMICCNAYRKSPEGLPNLTIRKIPQAVLNRCEWGRDDYSLNVEALQAKPLEVDDEAEANAVTNPVQGDLFGKDAS